MSIRKTVSFRSLINGRIVCADRSIPSPPGPNNRGGVVVRANRNEIFEWERHEVEFNLDGTISIRSKINELITALWSADGEHTDNHKWELLANRPDQPDNQAGPWERFIPILINEINIAGKIYHNVWAFQAIANGLFLRIEHGDSNGIIKAEGFGTGPFEAFWSSIPLILDSSSPTAKIKGRLRIQGSALVDDTGLILPVACHSGSAIADLLYERSTEEHNASLISRVGYSMRRVWTRLRGSFWTGREFGHETMGHEEYKSLLVDSFQMHQSLGLKLILSAGDILGIDNEHRIRTYVDLLSDALARVSPDGSLCAIFESGNELSGIWFLGSPERARDWILQPFKSNFPNVLCTNSQASSEDRNERFRWCLDPADLDDIHSFRGDNWWDWIRHIINNAYIHEHGHGPRSIIWSSEPFGCGGLVSIQPNKHQYDEVVAHTSIIAHLMTGQIPCYFSSPGIRFDIAQINFNESYELMPGFTTCPSIASKLPIDIMTWPRENIIHGGRSDPPGNPNPIFNEPGEGSLDRVYHVFNHDHSQFVALIFGPESLNSGTFRLYHSELDETYKNKSRLIIGRSIR